MLESIFDDLDDELEKQYLDEEVEFFQLETLVMAEEIVDASIQAAFKIIEIEDAEKLRKKRIEDSKSEIVAEKLMRPSEIRKSQRKAKNITKNSSEDSDSSRELLISKPVTVEATVETPPLELEKRGCEMRSEPDPQCSETTEKSDEKPKVIPQHISPDVEKPQSEPQTTLSEETDDKKPLIPAKGK